MYDVLPQLLYEMSIVYFQVLYISLLIHQLIADVLVGDVGVVSSHQVLP